MLFYNNLYFAAVSLTSLFLKSFIERLLSTAVIKAKIPQHDIMLEPPLLTKGSVTPVSGSTSVEPKMFSAAWNINNPAVAQAAIE